MSAIRHVCPVEGMSSIDWIASLSDAEFARYRELSGVRRAAQEKRLGRKLTGLELVELCDRPAAELVERDRARTLPVARGRASG